MMFQEKYKLEQIREAQARLIVSRLVADFTALITKIEVTLVDGRLDKSLYTNSPVRDEINLSAAFMAVNPEIEVLIFKAFDELPSEILEKRRPSDEPLPPDVLIMGIDAAKAKLAKRVVMLKMLLERAKQDFLAATELELAEA